jgi:hypothetical protein
MSCQHSQSGACDVCWTELARDLWSEEQRRDDDNRRVDAEHELLARWPARRRSPLWLLLAALPVLAALPIFGMREPATFAHAPHRTIHLTANVDAPAIAAGERFLEGETLQVPAGAHLELVWSIDGRLADPTKRVEIVGPASVRIGVNETVVAPRPAPAPKPVETPSIALPPRDREQERADFARAERELKEGRLEDARRRLRDLTHSEDVRLVGDATFLLVDSLPDAGERAGELARYLGTNPPDPYRAQAIAERAYALCLAGNVTAARYALDSLGASPPPVVHAVAGRARGCIAAR